MFRLRVKSIASLLPQPPPPAAFVRSIHPSFPASKKKHRAALEALEDNFEEDNFDQELDDLPADSSATTPLDSSSNLPHLSRWNNALASLDASLSLSSFELRSNTPSPRQLHWLLSRIPSPAQDQYDSALSRLQSWRRKGLDLPSEIADGFVRNCVANGRPDVAVDVLGNRARYGIDINAEEASWLDALFISLSESSSEITEPKVALQLVQKTLDIQSLHLPDKLPVVGLIALVELSFKVEQIEQGEKAIKSLKGFNETATKEAVEKLSNREKSWARDTLRVLSLELNLNKRSTEALWVSELADTIEVKKIVKKKSTRSTVGTLDSRANGFEQDRSEI